MNMPGFTAEASLYNGNVRYQSTTEATRYGGLVQPAQVFSDVFNPTGFCYCLGSECFCGPELINAPIGGGGSPVDHYLAQCRARCYHSRKRGAALAACLADC